MKEERTLDEIHAAVAEADGSITGAAEIMGISKQAVSKRLRSTRVVHEIWSRRNGDGAAAKATLKRYADDAEERIEKTVGREIRQFNRVQERFDLHKGKGEEFKARIEEAEAREQELLQEATEGSADAVSEEIAKVRAQRDTFKSIAENTAILVAELKLERDDAVKKLEAAVRRAVLAWREDVTADLVERLESIQAMDRAFETAVIERLNGMREQGLPVSPGILGITEASVVTGDELETLIRDLRRRLNARQDAERRKEEARKKEEEFRKPQREINVTGSLVQKP